MAREMCAHCDTLMRTGEGSQWMGQSFHSECRKCYVCSATDLHKAEIFKKTIFCYACSRRIFQGCDTSCRTKNKLRTRSQPKDRVKRRKLQRRALEVEKRRRLAADAVVVTGLDRAQVDCPVSSESVVSNFGGRQYSKDESPPKKPITDKCISTDVTKELLEIFTPHLLAAEYESLMPKYSYKDSRRRSRHNKSTHLSIAELGVSTEMAHMALRRRSDIPFIIKSGTALKRTKTRRSSEKVDTGTAEEPKSLSDCTYETQYEVMCWSEQEVKNVLMIPYISFKKKILDRSSIVSFLMKVENNKPPRGRMKYIIQNEIEEHRGRGVKKLYSTINRRRCHRKLGWLKTISRRNVNRCKHFESHSYRCMRANVMRAAGPTRSELALIRSKLKNIVKTDIIKKILKQEPQPSTASSESSSRNERLRTIV